MTETTQTEKAYLKQDGINTFNKYLLYGVEIPTKSRTVKKDKTVLKRRSRKLNSVRYFKKVGLGFTTPSEAIQGHYVDKKCPFTGDVSIRGRIIKGMVISTKMNKTIIVRRDYLHFVKKYSRY